MKVKKLIVIGCASAVLGLLAQGMTSLVPTAVTAEAPAPAAADATDIVKVQGKGSGVTRDEALKDAYRDAIERAVGLYVDAEQMVKNDALVSDQILTQSNAYIEKYDVVKETAANGLVTLRILATVKKAALTKKLSDVMPPQSFKLGNDAQNFHAAAVTQEKRSEDAAALLKKTLDGVNPITQLIRLSLADPKMMTRDVGQYSNDKRPCYFYRFKFELDEKKYYEEFLPPLLKVLDQISLTKPKTVRLQQKRLESQYENKKEYTMNYISSGDYMSNNSKESMMKSNSPALINLDGFDQLAIENQHLEGAYDGVIALGTANSYWHMSYESGSEIGYHCRFEPSGGIVSFEQACRNGNCKRMLEADAFPVMVITEMNASRTSVKTRCYELPKGCAEVIMAWQFGLIATSSSEREKARGRTAYNIILKDRNNEDVVVRSIAFHNVALINAMLGQGKMFKGEDYGGGYGWYVTPMIHTDAKSLQRWIGFDIPRDELPNIASISIELAE